MANLFLKQAKQYVATRPVYPAELFDFIASKTPRRDMAWDVGTGNGQAAASLATRYKAVVGTDTSAQQLAYATRLPNVRYVHTPPDLPLEGIHATVAAPASVDLITVAQAFHWLDLPRFYAQARSELRPGHGVLAAWCYTEPRIDAAIDAVFWRLYHGSENYWAPNRRMVDDEYRSADFPFDPVEGETHTGPFEFSTQRRMDLDDYLMYITSWSAYQTAKDKGVELLDEATVQEFEAAWGGDGKEVKTVTYPIFLRIGKTAKDSGVELLDEATVQEFAAAWGGDGKEVKTVTYPTSSGLAREVKAEQRQQPAGTPNKRRRPKPNKSAQANGGSSSSAADSPLSRTSSSSPPTPSGAEADGNGQQLQQHEQGGGGGKRPRLVWSAKLHNLFVEAYNSLGEEAVPRRILEKMNEKMSVPGVSREKVASHLQKHKLNLKRRAEEASSHSLPPNTPLAEAVVCHQAQLELVQVLKTPPADCLSRSGSSIAANLHIVQSSIQQQLFGPHPIKGGGQAQPAETMQRAPASDSGFSPVEGHGWGQDMETSTAAILVPEANTEAVMIRMAQAAKVENAAEPEAAPAAGILGQFWASPDNEASTSSWDIFGLSRGT